jgi:hypothetical protein
VDDYFGKSSKVYVTLYYMDFCIESIVIIVII